VAGGVEGVVLGDVGEAEHVGNGKW
jgi:hypothetical protein